MATLPASTSSSLVLADGLPLDSGQRLEHVTVAYETYGELAADKSNAILVHHALTGDQHLASPHPITGKPGWWSRMGGPGKPIDTDWLYPTAESRAVVHALNAVAAPVSFVELSAPYGHDSFLLDVPALDRVIAGFLNR